MWRRGLRVHLYAPLFSWGQFSSPRPHPRVWETPFSELLGRAVGLGDQVLYRECRWSCKAQVITACSTLEWSPLFSLSLSYPRPFYLSDFIPTSFLSLTFIPISLPSDCMEVWGSFLIFAWSPLFLLNVFKLSFFQLFLQMYTLWVN